MKKRITKWFSPGRLANVMVMVVVLMISQTAMAQGSVSGQVKDKEGKPVQGATITVKNKKVNAVSDVDGRFTVAAVAGDVLQVTSIGYEAFEIRIGSESNLTIELTTRVSSLDDVIVVGYGTQRKRDLSGSIVNVNVNETKKYSTSDISQILQGRATGVCSK